MEFKQTNKKGLGNVFCEYVVHAVNVSLNPFLNDNQPKTRTNQKIEIHQQQTLGIRLGTVRGWKQRK